jgi:transcriptional regulator with XRE-family HTH domain
MIALSSRGEEPSDGTKWRPDRGSNLVSGRQLRAARVLAGLTQKQLAKEAGFHERACRYWEARGNRQPTSTSSTLARIEAALLRSGVAVFRDPTPGARLISRREAALHKLAQYGLSQ